MDGAWVPGGPSLYASHVARVLGANVTLLTNLTPAFDRDSLRGLGLVALNSQRMPRYENSYAEWGARTQLLHDPGEEIPAAVIASAVAHEVPEITFFAPAYHELSDLGDIILPGMVALSAQGPLRARNGLRVMPVTAPEGVADTLVSPRSWVFFSTEDAGSCESGSRLGRAVTDRGASAIMTDGEHGVVVFRPGLRTESWKAVPARQAIDPTGAGDTFATSFLIRLAETGDELLAIRFALAASSLAVERRGVQNIPTRDEIESRAQMAGAA